MPTLEGLMTVAWKNKVLCCILAVAASLTTFSQDCVGGSIATKEHYLYGSFEVRMQSVADDGVVSSFFLYNIDEECNWPEENNEIDIEMTGNNEWLQFTTHYPSLTYHTDIVVPDFNPHADLHDYAIEWEPGIVRWFVDGALANVQDAPYVEGLIHPMEILMNCWPSEAVGWAGVWDPSVMPVEARYDYVRCYAYTPGTGSSGTDNNFSFLWEDNFDALDTSRWTVEKDGGFGGNFCRFKASGVEFRDGYMFLQIKEDSSTLEQIPVTFSVATTYEDFDASDVIYLNGTFNDWCGNCMPMTKIGDRWSVTIDLTPGGHEYLYSRNLWEETGGAPVGSDCDYRPCDIYNNYGFYLTSGTPYLVLDTPCWGSCEPCALPTGLSSHTSSVQRQLLRITDLLGRTTQFQPGQLLLYYYSDGSVEKKVVWE